jgi:hypothetical protein
MMARWDVPPLAFQPEPNTGPNPLPSKGDRVHYWLPTGEFLTGSVVEVRKGGQQICILSDTLATHWCPAANVRLLPDK